MVDIFFIGPGKSGSTFLYETIKNMIDCGKIKEPNFFNNNYDKGFFWYESLYSKNSEIKADFSNTYSFDKNVAERIKLYNPNASVIIFYRDPIDRLISHIKYEYLFNKNISLDLNFHLNKNTHFLYRGQIVDLFREYKNVGLTPSIMYFENLIKSPKNEIKKILDIDFQKPSKKIRKNKSRSSRSHALTSLGKRIAIILRENDKLKTLELLKSNLLINKIFYSTKQVEVICDKNTLKALKDYYSPTYKFIEECKKKEYL